MEGALAKVHVTISINPTQELNNEFLSFILKDFIEKEQTLKRLTIREIQECVAKKYGITVNQILSSDRMASLVTPRQLAMYISRKYTPKSLQEIAAEFDKKHATILHGVKSIEKRLDVEGELKGILVDVLSEFGYSINDKLE
jgi:chromosomal replication initiator protein